MALPSAPFGGFYPRLRSLCLLAQLRGETMCASQARPGSTQARLVTRPAVTGGRSFSADPGHEVLRLTLTLRADPASPARLPVYPMTGRR